MRNIVILNMFDNLIKNHLKLSIFPKVYITVYILSINIFSNYPIPTTLDLKLKSIYSQIYSRDIMKRIASYVY